MEAAPPHILQVQKEKGRGKKERGMKRSSLFPLLVCLFGGLIAVYPRLLPRTQEVCHDTHRNERTT